MFRYPALDSNNLRNQNDISRRRALMGMATPLALATLPMGCAQSSNEIRGFDISSDNGPIDWSAIPDRNFEFTYIRASQGTGFVDEHYARNKAGAQRVGLIVGPYHVYDVNGSGLEQAHHFLSIANLEQGMLTPMIDVEGLPDGSTPAQTVDKITQWLTTISAHIQSEFGVDKLPGIYLSPNTWQNLGQPNLGTYPLWLADWDVTTPDIPAAWHNYSFWQTSDTGSVPGISGPVDTDNTYTPLSDQTL